MAEVSAHTQEGCDLLKAQGTLRRRGQKECGSLKMGNRTGKEQDVGLGAMYSPAAGVLTEVRPS